MDFFKTYFIDILRYKYADFDGRARRKEFWMFRLCYVLTLITLGILMAILGSLSEIFFIIFGILFVILIIGLIIPEIAIAVRRLHDTDKSGWMYLISLIPFGGIILLIFFFTEGDRGPNQYGPDPKQMDGEYY